MGRLVQRAGVVLGFAVAACAESSINAPQDLQQGLAKS